MAINLSDIAAGTGGLVANGFENSAQAGRTVSRVGDVNGDGFDDFAVGAQLTDSGGSNRGEVYVVFGSDSGLPTSIALSDIAAGTGGFVIRGQGNNHQAGFALSAAGDVNGDGFDDIAIGAPYVANGGGNRGSSYVVFGSGASFAAGVNLSDVAAGTGGFVLAGFENNAFLGDSMGSGDFNGDGFDDVVIGAPYTNSGGSDRGEVYVFYGTDQGFAASTTLNAIPAGDGFVIRGNENNASFGYSVDFAGDINGDGFDDVIIGARRGDAGGSDRGAAYVVFGDDGDFSAGINISNIAAGNGGFAILGFENSARAGQSVAAAGDVNGDGIDDLIIGAPLTDSGGNNRGAAYVVYGTDDGFAATINLTDIAAGIGGFAIVGVEDTAQVGFDVAGAGDVNGDGFDDVVIGAYVASVGGTARGAAYVVFGNEYGIPAANITDLENGIGGFAIHGLENSAQAGRAVSAAGDVNDDGFGDLLIGAPLTNSGGTDRGAAYLIFGSETIGNVVNDAPVNTVPGAQTVDANTNLSVAGLSIADADAHLGPLTATLSVLHGTLTVASAGGASVGGSGTGTVTLTGTVAQINTTLAAADNVVYRGTLDYFGADTLTVTTNDGGNTGSGGAQTDTDQVAITVSGALNVAPVNTVPGAQSVGMDTNLAISGLSVADADAGGGSVTTTLGVLHGTLTVASAGGAAVGGSGTGTVTLTGTVTQINTTLAAANNVVYRGSNGYFGADTLAVTTNDGGNIGLGGAQSDTDNVAITVNGALNLAPVNTVPGAQSVGMDTNLAIAGLSVADADAGGGSVTTTLSVLHGTLTVASAGGAAVGGGGTGTVTLTGTVAQINTTLAAASNVVYRGSNGYFGADTLTVTTNDGGHTGSGGAHSDTDNVAITVSRAANVAPVNTVPGTQTVAANTDLAIAGLSIVDADAGGSSVTTTLTALHGTLTVASAGGASVGGSGTGTVTLTGTVAQINTTLAAAHNVIYRGASDYSGADTFTVTTNDGGNTGAGGARTDTDHVTINVTAPGPELPDLPDVLWQNDQGRVATAQHDLGTVPHRWQIVGTADFDADGDTDILWRHIDDQVVVWEQQDGQFVTNHNIGVASRGWAIAGTGDFDRDGDADIVWRHQEGGVVTWEMQDGNYVDTHGLPSVWDDWNIVGTGDFDGDGDDDLLWRHEDGAVATWEMEDGAYVRTHEHGLVSAEWQISTTGDFDGDGDDDILWRHQEDAVTSWEMQDGAYVRNHNLPEVADTWEVSGTVDLDDDGDSDIVWRHREGTAATWDMQDGAFVESYNQGVVATTWHIRGTGHFDLS